VQRAQVPLFAAPVPRDKVGGDAIDPGAGQGAFGVVGMPAPKRGEEGLRHDEFAEIYVRGSFRGHMSLTRGDSKSMGSAGHARRLERTVGGKMATSR
jgi:hypothetical protein